MPKYIFKKARVESSTRKCRVNGCNNLGEFMRKRADGSISRRWLCSTHNKKRFGYQTNGRSYYRRWVKRKNLGNKCSSCGWLGPCDIDRIIPGRLGGKYSDQNTRLLCPNCHRRKTFKELGYVWKKEWSGYK